jgi:SAM-dependent methyltransferase
MQPELFENMDRMEAEHWWFTARRRIALSVLQTLDLPPSSRLLDVGSGTGGTTVALKRFGEVEALEIDPAALRFLRDKPLSTIHDRPLPDPDLPGGAYDVVTAFDVLEHLDDDLGVTREIARLLKPDGHFLATVPAHPGLWTRHDELHHHRRRYDRASLRSLLDDAGLEVLWVCPWLTLLFPAFLAERALQRLRPPVSVELGLPPAPLNRLLAAVTAAERTWIRQGWSAPVGASWIALARQRRR